MADWLAGAMSPVFIEALPQTASPARASARLPDVDHLSTLDPCRVEIRVRDRGILALEPPRGTHVAVRRKVDLIAQYDIDTTASRDG
jgi:hypothetical protein